MKTMIINVNIEISPFLNCFCCLFSTDMPYIYQITASAAFNTFSNIFSIRLRSAVPERLLHPPAVLHR